MTIAVGPPGGGGVLSVPVGPPAPVPVYQWQPEFEALLNLYRARAPRRVLEIGTYHGGTLFHWLQNAVKGAVVVSVDSYTTGVDNRWRYPEWRPADVTLHAVSGNSHDPLIIAHVSTYGPYDWIFIDGGHYYDEVLRDWEAYRPLCAPGGVVAFHDILTHDNHPEIQVERLWRQIQKEGYRTEEIIVNPYADWGGIGVCYLP